MPPVRETGGSVVANSGKTHVISLRKLEKCRNPYLYRCNFLLCVIRFTLFDSYGKTLTKIASSLRDWVLSPPIVERICVCSRRSRREDDDEDDEDGDDHGDDSNDEGDDDDEEEQDGRKEGGEELRQNLATPT